MASTSASSSAAVQVPTTDERASDWLQECETLFTMLEKEHLSVFDEFLETADNLYGDYYEYDDLSYSNAKLDDELCLLLDIDWSSSPSFHTPNTTPSITPTPITTNSSITTATNATTTVTTTKETIKETTKKKRRTDGGVSLLASRNSLIHQQHLKPQQSCTQLQNDYNQNTTSSTQLNQFARSDIASPRTTSRNCFSYIQLEHNYCSQSLSRPTTTQRQLSSSSLVAAACAKVRK